MFKLETDPRVNLTFATHWTQVWFQWAGLADESSGKLLDCESEIVSFFFLFCQFMFKSKRVILSESVIKVAKLQKKSEFISYHCLI